MKIMLAHKNELFVATLGSVEDWSIIVSGLVPKRYTAKEVVE